LKIFWYRNDLAPLLRCTWNDPIRRWRLHLLTCLTTLVTRLEMTWLPWRPGAATDDAGQMKVSCIYHL